MSASTSTTTSALRGRHQAHRDREGAVVRRPRRSQVVLAAGGRLGGHRGASSRSIRRFPEVSVEARQQLQVARTALEGEAKDPGPPDAETKKKKRAEMSARRPDRRRPRPAPLRWCGDDPALRPLPRRGVGTPDARRRPAVREICLEGFQAGLSWITILRKRERFREVFEGFDTGAGRPFRRQGHRRVCLKDPGIVRHRGKIDSTINNARPHARAVRRVRLAGRLRVELGTGRSRPAGRDDPAGVAGDADHRRCRWHCPRICASGAGHSSVRRRSTRSCRRWAWSTTTSRDATCVARSSGCGGASCRPAPPRAHIWARVKPAAPSNATSPSAPSRWAPPDHDQAGRRLGRAAGDLRHPVAIALDQQPLVDLRRVAKRLQQQPIEGRRGRPCATP